MDVTPERVCSQVESGSARDDARSDKIKRCRQFFFLGPRSGGIKGIASKVLVALQTATKKEKVAANESS